MKSSATFSSVNPSTLSQIKAGSTTKKKLGSSATTRTVQGKAGKFAITETSHKFEESGVAKKKKNYVMFQSKLGTEKQQGLTQIRAAQPKPRKVDTIIQTRKKKEYLDNFQYKETKDIKNNDPRKESFVRHRRLGEPVGGTYEQKTFTKRSSTNRGSGPSLYSSTTTRTTRTSGAPKTTSSFVQNNTSISTPIFELPESISSLVQETSSSTTSLEPSAVPTLSSVVQRTTSTSRSSAVPKTVSTVVRSSSSSRTSSKPSGVPKTVSSVVRSSSSSRTSSKTSGVPKKVSSVVRTSSSRTSSRTSGAPKTVSSVVRTSSSRTSSKTSGAPKIVSSVVRTSSSTTSSGPRTKTVPAKSQNYRAQIKKFSTSTQVKGALTKPAPTSGTRSYTIKTASSKFSSRSQSAGKGRL